MSTHFKHDQIVWTQIHMHTWSGTLSEQRCFLHLTASVSNQCNLEEANCESVAKAAVINKNKQIR